MQINGMGYTQTDYNRVAPKFTREDKFELSDGQVEKGMEKDPLSRQKKGEGAPYSYLADENGIIEYKGVVFVCDNERKWLCLGDMSNLDDVIRIPLSEGGCLMVNRDNIGDLSHAIGMFSPEDINRILRALKMDAKIRQMKKEIQDMEDGVGKSSKEQYADSTEEAKEAAAENEKADAFHIIDNLQQRLQTEAGGKEEKSRKKPGDEITAEMLDKLLGIQKKVRDNV